MCIHIYKYIYINIYVHIFIYRLEIGHCGDERDFSAKLWGQQNGGDEILSPYKCTHWMTENHRKRAHILSVCCTRAIIFLRGHQPWLWGHRICRTQHRKRSSSYRLNKSLFYIVGTVATSYGQVIDQTCWTSNAVNWLYHTLLAIPIDITAHSCETGGWESSVVVRILNLWFVRSLLHRNHWERVDTMFYAAVWLNHTFLAISIDKPTVDYCEKGVNGHQQGQLWKWLW